MTEVEILKTAILNEVEGQQFYMMAAAKAEDPEVAAAFRSLAHDEKQHEAWLRKMLERIMQKSTDNSEAYASNIPSPNIFRAEKVGPESGSLEISVYKIGILMEMASMQFYNEAVEQAQTPALKKLLQTLASWEDSHLVSLQRVYDELKTEWWDRQGFSPA